VPHNFLNGEDHSSSVNLFLKLAQSASIEEVVEDLADIASEKGIHLHSVMVKRGRLEREFKTPSAVAVVGRISELAAGVEGGQTRLVVRFYEPTYGAVVCELEYAAYLAAHRIELVVLAGYLRLVPADVVAHYRGRILNIHPALLPDFGGPGMYGHHVHEAVLASGVRLTGPTVHFVDERFDNGPIIAHLPIRVLPTDTAESLASRVLEIEHELYPRIIEAVADGSITLAADNSVVLPEGVHFRFTPAADREDANRQITNAFFPLPY